MPGARLAPHSPFVLFVCNVVCCLVLLFLALPAHGYTLVNLKFRAPLAHMRDVAGSFGTATRRVRFLMFGEVAFGFVGLIQIGMCIPTRLFWLRLRCLCLLSNLASIAWLGFTVCAHCALEVPALDCLWQRDHAIQGSGSR